MAYSNYAKGREYEMETVRIVNRKHGHYGWKAVRKHLSGQGGGEDVKLSIPTAPDDGIVLLAEQKVAKAISKNLWEWKKDNDLLIVKKIGAKYPRLVAMDFDFFLDLVGQLAQLLRNPNIVSDIPKNESEGDDDSQIL